jgi:hypothetical protein
LEFDMQTRDDMLKETRRTAQTTADLANLALALGAATHVELRQAAADPRGGAGSAKDVVVCFRSQVEAETFLNALRRATSGE